MKTYLVRAEEKRTTYGVTLYKVQATSADEAKQKVLDDSSELEDVESWDTNSDNHSFIDEEGWEIKEDTE